MAGRRAGVGQDAGRKWTCPNDIEEDIEETHVASREAPREVSKEEAQEAPEEDIEEEDIRDVKNSTWRGAEERRCVSSPKLAWEMLKEDCKLVLE